ncbi:MAG TPA: tetratricopeptide repeat protein [Verrucomicrobiae bacterium]|jgi:tetratricopeptide (TPR) repeat protein|nr:tetratricopeptide repeat protein [Verrucomicrobiae bacterium]
MLKFSGFRKASVALRFGFLLLISIASPQLRADESSPHGKPNVKAWSAKREAGQKAFEKKDFSAAKGFFTEALEQARNFDAKDYRLAESLSDLAAVDGRLGDLTEAEPLFHEAAEIRHGDANAGYELSALFGWGAVSQALKHFDDAATAYQRAEDLCSRKFGRDSGETVLCSFRLGMVYYHQRDFAKAEPLLRRAFTLFRNPASKIVFRKTDPMWGGMDVFRVEFRPNHVYALQAIGALTQIYIAEKNLPEAERALKDALDLVDEYAGKDDPEIPDVLRVLSNFYYSTSNYVSAEPILQRLMKIQDRKQGANDETTLFTEDRLAQVYAHENKSAQAESLYEKIIAQREKNSGPESRDTMIAVANLGKLYLAEGKYEKAEPLYQRLFAQVEKNSGGDVAFTPILADQVIIYSKLGKDAELEAALRRQISVFEKMFGPNSRALVKPLTDCAQVLRKQKRDAEAEPLEARANVIKAAQAK